MEYTPIDQFKFTIDKNDHLILTKYIGIENIVNVAPTYIINNKEYKVEKINQGCFLLFEGKLKLSNGIKLTEGNFFENEIEEIELPNDIIKIPKFCFSYCDKLKKVTLSEKTEKLETKCFLSCKKLKEINIPKNIKEIESNVFGQTDIKIKDFENKYIKIKNNNIYQKEVKNNETLYMLTNCLQKNDTLILKKNETCHWLENDNIKNLIINKEPKKESNISSKSLETLIINTKINFHPFLFDLNNIKNLYIKNAIGRLSCIITKNLYYNNTISEFNKLETHLFSYENLICQKSINELLKENYSFKQIDLITKGYQKGILLSNTNKNIDENILRNIINNFTCEDIELYDILELLQKEEITLEDNLEIQNKINNKINNKNQDKLKQSDLIK